MTNSELFPDHASQFNFWRKDRADVYGGVLLGIRNSILAEPAPKLDADSEIVWAKVLSCSLKDAYIGKFYHPHYDVEKGLEGLADSMSKLPPNSNVFLGGDFNLPDIDWKTSAVKPWRERTYRDSERHCDSLLNTFQDHGMEQCVNFPTRIENTLDLLASNNPSLLDIIKPIPGISDHDNIIQASIHLSVNPKKVKPHKIFKFKQANYSDMKEEMKEFSEHYFNSDPSDRTITKTGRSSKPR